MGNSLSLASLASLARHLEFCLASRKTSKMQEIAHYTITIGLTAIMNCVVLKIYKHTVLGYFSYLLLQRKSSIEYYNNSIAYNCYVFVFIPHKI